MTVQSKASTSLMELLNVIRLSANFVDDCSKMECTNIKTKLGPQPNLRLVTKFGEGLFYGRLLLKYL